MDPQPVAEAIRQLKEASAHLTLAADAFAKAELDACAEEITQVNHRIANWIKTYEYVLNYPEQDG